MQFGDRIDMYIKIYINLDPQDDLGIINALEKFSEKLFPFVEKIEGKTKLAKRQVFKPPTAGAKIQCSIQLSYKASSLF